MPPRTRQRATEQRKAAEHERDQLAAQLRHSEAHHADLHTKVNALENDLRSQTRAVREATTERDRVRARHAQGHAQGGAKVGYEIIATRLHRDNLGALVSGDVVASAVSARPTLAEAVGELLRAVRAVGPAEQAGDAAYEQIDGGTERADPGSSCRAQGDAGIAYIAPGGALFARRPGFDGWFGTNGGYARDLTELDAEYGPTRGIALVALPDSGGDRG